MMGKDKHKDKQLYIDVDVSESTNTESVDIGLYHDAADKNIEGSADDVKKKAGEFAKAAGGMVGSLGKFAAKKGSELKDKLGDEEFQEKTISIVKHASSKTAGTTTAAVKTATNIAKKAISKKEASSDNNDLTVDVVSADKERIEDLKPKKGVAASIERKKVEKAEKKAEKERLKKEAQQKSLKMGLLLMGIVVLISVGIYFIGGTEDESVPDGSVVEEVATEDAGEEDDTSIHEEPVEEEPPVEAPVIGDDIGTVGDKVVFGEFDGSAISWWVCENQDGKSLIVATSQIAEKPFNEAVTADAVDWKLSTLRTFLNETFISEAFNDSERQCILETEFKGDDLTTQDRVFILSEEQYRKYSDLSNITFSGNCWLIDVISTTLTRQEENDIDRHGEIDCGLRNNENCGVRPAMWVDTETFKAITE
jgi:hypothetical protein